MIDDPGLGDTARKLASLAIERLTQNGTLGVRQREELRRALAAAADALEWGRIPGAEADRVALATRDVARLADVGAKSLERDLADLMEEKSTEMEQLEAVASRVQDMAADAGSSYPAEVEYSHTVRDGSRCLVTRSEVLVLNDAGEAVTAAARLERRFESSAKLRDQMIEELKRKQRQLNETRDNMSAFVEWSGGLLVEVLVTRV